MTLIQTEKNGIQIRLIVTKCDCGPSKIAIEKEAKTFESKIEANDQEELVKNSKAYFFEPIDESIRTIEVEPESEPNAINVFESSDKFDEFGENVYRFRSEKWRLFTSVLPGLFLFLTLAVINVVMWFQVVHLIDYYRE